MSEPLDRRNRSFGDRAKRFFDILPARLRTYGYDWFGWIGGVCGLVWEVRNAALGFERLYAPGLFLAFVAGAAATMSVLYFTRLMMERFRQNKVALGIVPGFMALLGCGVVLFGVWANLASDSLDRGQASIETHDARRALIADIQQLETDMRLMPPPIPVASAELGVERTIGIAANLNLDLGDMQTGADQPCAKPDISRYARNLCDKVAEWRQQIAASAELEALRTQTQTSLEEKRGQLAQLVEAEGVRHFEEMARLLNRPGVDWAFVANIGILFLSGAMLLIIAFIFDHLMERRERRTALDN